MLHRASISLILIPGLALLLGCRDKTGATDGGDKDGRAPDGFVQQADIKTPPPVEAGVDAARPSDAGRDSPKPDASPGDSSPADGASADAPASDTVTATALYFNGFESGTLGDPEVNVIGAQSVFVFDVAPIVGGVSTEKPKTGSYGIRVAHPDPSFNQNGGKTELFWSTSQPIADLWVKYDLWIDSAWSLSDGHMKLLAVWEDTYNADFSARRAICVIESQWENSLPTARHGAISIQRSCDCSSHGVSQYPFYYNGQMAKFPDGAADTGRWVNIVFRVKVAQTAGEQGLVEIWKDGAKILSEPRDNYTAASVNRGFSRMYTIGNMSRGYAAAFSHYIDNLTISAAPLL